MDEFSTSSSLQKDAWYSFKAEVKHFLGIDKTEDYEEIVPNLLKIYHKTEVNMSLKIHLHLHAIVFQKKTGIVRDEHGEWFHHDLT